MELQALLAALFLVMSWESSLIDKIREVSWSLIGLLWTSVVAVLITVLQRSTAGRAQLSCRVSALHVQHQKQSCGTHPGRIHMRFLGAQWRMCMTLGTTLSLRRPWWRMALLMVMHRLHYERHLYQYVSDCEWSGPEIGLRNEHRALYCFSFNELFK